MTTTASSGPKRSRRGRSASSPCAATTRPASPRPTISTPGSTAAGVETLYDDRDERGGAKLAGMDLIGLPWQIIIGPRGLANGVVELKDRRTGVKAELSPDDALARLTP